MIKYLESFFFNITLNDVTEPWSLFFPDNTTPQMEGLEESHNIIMWFLAIILFAFALSMLFVISDSCEAKISNKDVNYGTLLKFLWTITVALILVLIAFLASFCLTKKLLDMCLVNDAWTPTILSLIFILLIGVSLMVHLILNESRTRMWKNLNKTASNRCILAPLNPHQLLKMHSSLDNIVITGVTAYSIIVIIVKCSAYLFAAAIYLNMFSTHITLLPVHLILSIMQHMIENTQRIIRGVTSLLENPDITRETLTQLHQYLTPYIRSHESLFFEFFIRIFRYFEGRVGPQTFSDLEYALEDYREAGNNLLRIYRSIEEALVIPMNDSPIPLQDVEN